MKRRGIAGGLSEANPIGTIIGIIIARVHTVIRYTATVTADNGILKVASTVENLQGISHTEKKEKENMGWIVSLLS